MSTVEPVNKVKAETKQNNKIILNHNFYLKGDKKLWFFILFKIIHLKNYKYCKMHNCPVKTKQNKTKQNKTKQNLLKALNSLFNIILN
ncbi:hypothetical protein Ctaglu_13640 [Clostridium tagluense]|uniref:Uncharacterized protein n=1 Tax=Clostridium tagluense TaxID=360422 RepID=A0A401UJJ6_9CLOT|nr:hypothetical protein Ctaglu_13640 [Clostridium tagluense]